MEGGGEGGEDRTTCQFFWFVSGSCGSSVVLLVNIMKVEIGWKVARLQFITRIRHTRSPHYEYQFAADCIYYL